MAVGVEAHAEPLSSRTRSGESSQSTSTALGRGDAAARRRSCRPRGARASRRRPARRRCRPGPSSWRTRPAASGRPARRARRRGRRRAREEARGAGADDVDIGRRGCGRVGHESADTVDGIAAPLYLRHPSSLEHDTGPHPERPDRIRAIEAADGRPRLARLRRPRGAAARPRSSSTRVHPPEPHRRRCASTARPAAPFDADTPVVPASWEAALRAAGAACALVDALLAGAAPTGFCGLRPPGHHAEPDRAMGFCLFANVAIAAEHALDAHGVERVLILDWDVHHGNGTQRRVPLARRTCCSASLHQWPFYPGTGALGDVGVRRGRGVHDQPAGARRVRASRSGWALVEHVVVPGRARVRARPDPGLGRLRRPPRRPAGRVQPRDRRLPPAGPARGGARRPSSACPRARSSRAATTWTRSPSRRRRRWRRSRRAARRAVERARWPRRCRAHGRPGAALQPG